MTEQEVVLSYLEFDNQFSKTKRDLTEKSQLDEEIEQENKLFFAKRWSIDNSNYRETITLHFDEARARKFMAWLKCSQHNLIRIENYGYTIMLTRKTINELPTCCYLERKIL